MILPYKTKPFMIGQRASIKPYYYKKGESVIIKAVFPLAPYEIRESSFLIEQVNLKDESNASFPVLSLCRQNMKSLFELASIGDKKMIWYRSEKFPTAQSFIRYKWDLYLKRHKSKSKKISSESQINKIESIDQLGEKILNLSKKKHEGSDFVVIERLLFSLSSGEIKRMNLQTILAIDFLIDSHFIEKDSSRER